MALGLCESRSKAQAYILAGKVRLGTERIDKSGRMLPSGSILTVEQPMPYVGRGGLKMAGFIEGQGIDPKGLEILDLGASTGDSRTASYREGRLRSLRRRGTWTTSLQTQERCPHHEPRENQPQAIKTRRFASASLRIGVMDTPLPCARYWPRHGPSFPQAVCWSPW